MADETPRRQSSNSDDDQSPSQPLNRAYANRHGNRSYETLYPGESQGEGSGSGRRPRSHTRHSLSTIAESPSPERRLPYTPPARPSNPVTRSLAHSSDVESTIDSDASSPPESESESPGSVTRAQNPVEDPILATQSSTPAWWRKGGQGYNLYSLSPLASTNNLTLGHDIGEDISNHPYLHLDRSAPPDVRSSAPASSDLPARPAADDYPRLTQALLQAFTMPNPPPVSGRARSDAISMANMSHLPVQAHIPTSADQTGSPPSGKPPESPSSAQVGNTNPRPAQYRLTPSTSSSWPLSGNRPAVSLSTSNVSPLPGHGSRPVSSCTVCAPSGNQQPADRVLEIASSSSTLFYNQDRQTLMVQQQPEVQLELTEALNTTPQTNTRAPGDSTQPNVDATQPKVTVTRLIGDGNPTPPRKSAVKANARRVDMFSPPPRIDERRFLFPRYKFEPWQA